MVCDYLEKLFYRRPPVWEDQNLGMALGSLLLLATLAGLIVCACREMTSGAFRARLDRGIRLALRAMRDGCADCRAAKGFCHEHKKQAVRIALDPRKYLDLRGRK